MMWTFRRPVLCAALAAGGATRPVVAQVAESIPANAITRLAMFNEPDGTDSARASAIVLPRVTASGAPRTYQVVPVQVPEVFSHAAEIDVEIIARGEFVVLGPSVRKLGGADGRRTRLAVTIGIPASALAGTFIAAEARFSAVSIGTLVVPIEMSVQLVRDVAIRAPAAPVTGDAGADIIVPFEIVNRGNATETLHADLDVPSGWPTRGLNSSGIVVQPGETVRRRVRLAIPALSSTGSSFVRVDLRDRGSIIQSATIRIEVSNAASIGANTGPRIVSAISHTADESGRPSRIATVNLTGPLFDSVQIDARMSRGSALSGAASTAFSRLGSYPSPFSLLLSAPSGQLSVGRTGASLSDLTGLYPYGQGALLQLGTAGWGVTAFAARSIAAPGAGDTQPMVALAGSRLYGRLRLNSSISRLSDGAASPRRLHAVGVGGSYPSLFGSTLRAEIAHRRFAGGGGLGWSTGISRSQGESDQQLAITHSPGGSDAFARATNEVSLRLSERFSPRFSLSGGAWRTADETSVFSALESNGFSLRPQYQVFNGTTVSLEMRSYLFDASTRGETGGAGSGGAFGSREQQIGVSLSTSLRQFYAYTSAYLGTVTRTVSPVGLQTLTDRTPRNYWATNAGWSGVGGRIEVQTRMEQTRDQAGIVNQQNLYGVRAEQVALPGLGGIQAEGELQRVNGFANERSTIMRAGVAVPLVRRFLVRMGAERNSVFRSVTGQTPWIFAARFEHAFGIPMLRKPGVSGYVFQDLNGNHRRDPDELGVPGAIVRRGSESTVADDAGRFRVAGDAGQPIVLDEASLPEGWVATGLRDGNLPISLSSAVHVRLVLAPRSGIAEVEVDLRPARVIARDSAGREWTARMAGAATAIFDALPAGTYALVFDLSGLSETLVPRAPVPVLVVTGREAASVTVTLDPRPIRMWQPSSAARPSKTEAETTPPNRP